MELRNVLCNETGSLTETRSENCRTACLTLFEIETCCSEGSPEDTRSDVLLYLTLLNLQVHDLKCRNLLSLSSSEFVLGCKHHPLSACKEFSLQTQNVRHPVTSIVWRNSRASVPTALVTYKSKYKENQYGNINTSTIDFWYTCNRLRWSLINFQVGAAAYEKEQCDQACKL